MADYNDNSQYGDGGFDQGETSFLGDGSQKTLLRTSLTPVTIKQIEEATQPVPDGLFQSNGVNLNLVSFVAVVRKVDVMDTSIAITVEDGTGSWVLRQWINENKIASEEASKFNLFLNKYVLITGGLTQFSGKKNIQNWDAREVTNHNQVVYHFLGAIDVHIKSQGITSSTKNDLFVNNGEQPTGSIHDRIYTVLKDHTVNMPEGVPVQLMAQELGVSDAQALSVVQELVEQGRAYLSYEDHMFLAI